MKNYNLALFLLLMFLIPFIGFSQNNKTQATIQNEDYPVWVGMMKDLNVNFYDVQETFNDYFIDRPKGKGSGWKQFKRWEFFMEQRVYPSGKRLNHTQVWDEIMKFRKKYPADNYRSKSNWTDLGPHTSLNVTGHWNPGIGRINVIAREPGNPQTLYIGAPSGGLWKTTDEGANWEVLTDDLPVMGVSAIAIDPANTNIIYIGTGDNDHSDNYSIGILKSTDGGYTWDVTGLDWTIYQNRTIAKLLIHPTNSGILFAATTNGLYKTTDAGATWTRTHTGDIDDIEFKPGDPNTIYAVTQNFYKSVDCGNTFTETTGVPTTSRVQIAVTEANPEYVYFFSSKNGIYRSTNSGDSFYMRSVQPNPGYQDWYDLAMAVSHVNPEEVHIGEINTWRSLDGGTSWTKTTDWTWGNPLGYTHCDIHELVFYDGTLYVGSDGLISKSTDQGNNWTNLTEGIGIRQFYRIGGTKTDPYKLLGGSQDNGTSVYTTDYWHEWLGADGMECLADYTNSDIVYGTSQNGVFYKSNAGGNHGGVSISQPGGGSWITPFVIHPTNPETLFVGSSEVKKTTNGMSSWSTISSLGLGNLNALTIAESDPDYLYASKSSTIYRTKNGGSTWSNISSGLPDLYITYIAVHPSDPERIAVSISGYEDGEKVYISEDAGDTWENFSANLPNIPANCVIYYDDPNNALYVGMDVGVYYRDNNLTEWESYMTGLPNVIVNELEINYVIEKIRAGTFGRGLWESDLQIIAPIADFEANQTLIPIECSINYTSLSSGPPASYEWTFEGGTPETSGEMNPSDIVYNVEGLYNVTLIVSNSLGTDTLVREDYISVSSSLLPSTDFSVSDSITCSNTVVDFTDLTLNCPNSWEWTFSPDNVTFTNGTNENSQNPSVIFEVDVYTVSLTTYNAVGNNTMTKTDYIRSGGMELPFLEDFESGNFDSGSWVVENPDESKTWEITTVGGSFPGDKAAWMNFFNYYALDVRDMLISPPLNFSGYNNLSLYFEHAYTQRYNQIDSLIVYISDNCGVTWTRIFEGGPDGTGVFATYPPSTSFFTPVASEDWCGNGYGSMCNNIDISDWDGLNNVKIMFESFSKFGNNLYIDNIFVSNSVGINNPENNDIFINISPNPSNGIFNIEISKIDEAVNMNILNIQGQVVKSKILRSQSNNSIFQLDLSAYPKGIYLIEFSSNKFIKTEKIIIK